MPGPEHLEQLIALLHARDRRRALTSLCQQVAPGQTGPNDTVLGLAWATADAEGRSASIIAPFQPRPRDQLLGGQALGVRFGRLELLLERPAGRDGIAAFVSRYGEGVAAIYVERPGFVPPAGARRRSLRTGGTPFGRRGWLMPHEWPWGPFVIVLLPREHR